jgi:hypothetical protein
MTRKIHASLLALLMIAAFALAGGKASPKAAAAASGSELLSALPPSDIIAYVDTERVSTDVIPTIFAAEPQLRAKLEDQLNDIKKEIGFDPRTIEAVAIGMNLDESRRARGYDFTFILRGRFDATATIEAGFDSAVRKVPGELEKQTRLYEGRTIYVLAPASRATAGNGEPQEAERELSAHTMVFVALDPNTVAFGNLKSVQATIDASMGRTRVDDELVQLATRTPNAVSGFSGNVPPELMNSIYNSKRMKESLNSVKQIYGSFNLAGGDAEALVNLRTETSEQARQLSTTLNGLKLMAKISGVQGSGNKRSLEPLFNGLSINAVGNEVQFTLKVAATDLAPFVRHF